MEQSKISISYGQIENKDRSNSPLHERFNKNSNELKACDGQSTALDHVIKGTNQIIPNFESQASHTPDEEQPDVVNPISRMNNSLSKSSESDSEEAEQKSPINVAVITDPADNQSEIRRSTT